MPRCQSPLDGPFFNTLGVHNPEVKKHLFIVGVEAFIFFKNVVNFEFKSSILELSPS